MAPIRLPKLNRSRYEANPFPSFFSPEVIPTSSIVAPWDEGHNFDAPFDYPGLTQSSDGFLPASPLSSLFPNVGGVVYWNPDVWGPAPDCGDSLNIVDLDAPSSGTLDRALTPDFDFSVALSSSTISSDEDDGALLPTVTTPSSAALNSALESAFDFSASSNTTATPANKDSVFLPDITNSPAPSSTDFSFEDINSVSMPASSASTPVSDLGWTVPHPQCVDNEVWPLIKLPTVPPVPSFPFFEDFSPASTPGLIPSSSASTPSGSSSIASLDQQYSLPTRNVAKKPRKNPGPPKPENSFLLFRRSQNAARARDAETLKSMGIQVRKTHQTDFSRVVSARWWALAPEERKFWDDLAEEKKREHGIMHPDYRYPVTNKAKTGGQKKKATANRRLGDADHVPMENPFSPPMTYNQSFYGASNAGRYPEQNDSFTNMLLPMPGYGPLGSYQGF